MLERTGPLPIVMEHRDPGPWNLFVSRDQRVHVLDWESSEPLGLPALDLVYFLTYLAFQLDGAEDLPSRRSSYRAALDPSTTIGRIVAESLARYGALTGLDPAAYRPLRILTWLIHSRSEYRQFEADAAGRPSLESLRHSLFVSLWNEELTRGTGSSALRLEAEGRVSHVD